MQVVDLPAPPAYPVPHELATAGAEIAALTARGVDKGNRSMTTEPAAPDPQPFGKVR